MTATAIGAHVQQFIFLLRWRKTTPGVGNGATGNAIKSMTAASISRSEMTEQEHTITGVVFPNASEVQGPGVGAAYRC